MADNNRDKRMSLGNRVATPRVGNQQQQQQQKKESSSSGGGQDISTDTAIARSIGARIRVTTSSSPTNTLEAHIFSTSTSPPLLTLTPSWPPPLPPAQPALTILPLSSIQSFTLLSLPPASAPPALVPDNPSTQAHNLRLALDSFKKSQARIGKGVSKEGQEIFDGINRTLACRWEGKVIVVLEAVRIAEPYRVEDARAPGGGAGGGGGKGAGVGQMLGRVKKVLENERKKIAERNTAAAQGTGGEAPAVLQPAELRKGG